MNETISNLLVPPDLSIEELLTWANDVLVKAMAKQLKRIDDLSSTFEAAEFETPAEAELALALSDSSLNAMLNSSSHRLSTLRRFEKRLQDRKKELNDRRYVTDNSERNKRILELRSKSPQPTYKAIVETMRKESPKYAELTNDDVRGVIAYAKRKRSKPCRR